ncbi:MAG: hypothetical protein KAW67_10310, partial [Candidatus Eisenbacteria sp.]|nr:hypothetical protein [Candidatus Eisenbacteria bacterium]
IDVHLKSGEVMEGAAYRVDERFKVLQLTLDDGRTRSVSFSEIATITSGGANVTPSILGPGYLGEPLPDPSAAPTFVGDPGQADEAVVPDGAAVAAGSEESREAAPTTKTTESGGQDTWLSEQEGSPAWRVAVRAAGNFSIPFGDYYEGVASGVGFEGDLLFAVTTELGVRLSVSKSGMQWEEGAIEFISDDPDVTILSQSFGLSAVRFTASCMGYWPLDKEQQRADRSMLYAYGGLGVIQHELTADITLREESTGSTFSLNSEDTQSYFLLTCGAGVIKSLSSRFGADLSVNLDQVWVDSESLAYVADIRGGLVVFF